LLKFTIAPFDDVRALAGKRDADGSADAGVGARDDRGQARQLSAASIGALAVIWPGAHGIAASGVALFLAGELRPRVSGSGIFQHLLVRCHEVSPSRESAAP
jgi:hypothetical protein